MSPKWNDPKLVLIADLQQKRRNINGLQRMSLVSVFLSGHGWMILDFASTWYSLILLKMELLQILRKIHQNFEVSLRITYFLFVAIPGIHHDGCLDRCIHSGRPNRVIPQQVPFSVSRQPPHHPLTPQAIHPLAAGQ